MKCLTRHRSEHILSSALENHSKPRDMTTDNATRHTILVVDDTPENIDILANVLGGQHTVKAATNGRKALAIAQSENPPDLILLDIMMPDMNGYQVCQQLKSDKKTKNIPVIFVSALGETGDQQHGLELGAVDYIIKPISAPIVKARVRNHLMLKKHQDHLEDLVAMRTQELELTQDATIASMALLAEYRDPETGGHIMRTRNYVRILATELQTLPEYAPLLSQEAITMLFKSAPLHDIGKVGIPDHILLKPGKLTDDEFAVMKKHATFGYEAIKATEQILGSSTTFLRYAKEIAYSHHEKWDGSGYPQGLSGGDIPLSGRLMAVADVYDALISKRVYKPPFPHQQALAIIADGKGSHFDPQVVNAFLRREEELHQTAYAYADFAEEKDMLSNGQLTGEPCQTNT